jgi:hypothetical protein
LVEEGVEDAAARTAERVVLGVPVAEAAAAAERVVLGVPVAEAAAAAE